MRKLLFLPVVCMILLTSCKKDNVIPTPLAVTPEMARDSLYYIMKQYYLWYNMPQASSVTEANKNIYNDPYKLLEAMRYWPVDRWSFVAEYNAFLAEYEGSFVGHGIRVGVATDSTARIVSIYNNSPLYASGVRRGWIIKKINNIDIASLLLADDIQIYEELLGPKTEGVTNTFLFKKPSGSEITISSAKTAFTVNTVLKCDTFQLSTGTTGHLVFDSFIEPSANELASAFEYFIGNGVKDLILDLRYNTGGDLAIADLLASYIAGNSHQGAIFAKFQYNDKHPEENFSFKYESTSYSLELPRIVVITSRSTASASEAVINGLKPFVNVVTIGDTTNGKPTGMNLWPVGQKYIMAPVTFKMVNANNEGDYYAGFPPEKEEIDDITHDFSDRQEACLKEAIYYLENGSVSTKGAQEFFKRYPMFSEKPQWMNNAFLLKNN